MYGLNLRTKEILNILLLTNSYFPQKNITNEEFFKLKSDWLIKNGDLKMMQDYLIKNQNINENINKNERFQFILDLEDKALATSGNYRKFYEKDGVKYAHTINPFTGFPTQNRLLSATVIHDNCMLADAYATAFMVMGVKKSKRFVKSHPEIEIYLVYTNKNGKWNTFISADLQKRIVN